MNLEEQIATRAREIKTDGYPMSIGEVLSLYRDGDIDIHPEFQRIFRWNSVQKSRLIESILLGIPIPPIFVSQRDDGIWDVIDGVQRLSTVLEFVGMYRGEDGNRLPPSTLTKTEYLPALDGYRWEDGPDPTKVFSESLRRDVKRAKMEFRIIRKESDSNAKYDLFQRLNSGAQLSSQEARNCLLVMMNIRLFEKIRDMSEDSTFATCVPLSERQEDQAYRQELMLRFFAQADFHGSESQLREEYGEYLTTWMRTAAERETKGGKVVDPELFRRAFRLLASALGEALADEYLDWSWAHAATSPRVDMPSRTVEELQDALDASLSWRRIELSALRAEVDRSSRQNSASPLARVLARSGVALLYAHWEGFTKDAFVAYVEFLSRRRLRLSQLNDGLLRTVFLSLQRRIASGDDAALDHFLKAMRNPSSARAQIPRRGMVNTRSNLRYSVLLEILESVGMDANDFSTKSNLIDRSLCDARNEIAHGREQFPSAEEFHALYQEMMSIMETLRHRILEEVRTETYKASKFATGWGDARSGLAAL